MSKKGTGGSNGREQGRNTGQKGNNSLQTGVRTGKQDLKSFKRKDHRVGGLEAREDYGMRLWV